jgi:hypothetical protein
MIVRDLHMAIKSSLRYLKSMKTTEGPVKPTRKMMMPPPMWRFSCDEMLSTYGRDA